SGLDSARRIVDKNGIYVADVVVVPLEDGDRTLALKKAGKKVITFDLNPLSRTAQTADVTIVDNVVRGIQELITVCRKTKNPSKTPFDNKKNLTDSIIEIRNNLTRRAFHA
ncbi:MAG: phosphopantothenate/pantothenate synthetase family protein, partial [Nitrososphaerota archaeon]